MTAARADARVITMRKPQDEVLASRSSRGALDLLVGGLRPAHANVLTNAVVEEIGVLRNEGNEIVELRERNIRTLPAADLQAARIYIPIAGNQACKRRLAAAALSDECVQGMRCKRKAHAMQHFLAILVRKAHIRKLDASIEKLDIRCAMMLFLRSQQLVSRSDDRPDLRHRVNKPHGLDQRPCDPQRKDHRRHEHLHAHAPLHVKKPAAGQNRQKRRRRDRHRQGDGKLAVLHPLIEIRGVRRDAARELLVGRRALVERLDDLDAADVLDDSGVHCLRRRHRRLEAFLVIAHGEAQAKKPDGDGNDCQERHAPIKHKQIAEDAERADEIRRQLGQKMRERALRTLHLVNDDVLDLADRQIRDRAERQLRQLLQDLPANFTQDGERRLMRDGKRVRIENAAQQVADERGEAQQKNLIPLQATSCQKRREE